MVLEVEVFTSSSCPYCPMAENVAVEAKNEVGDSINLSVINISQDRQKAIEYNIMAVPAIAIDGEVVFVGAPSKEDLISAINSRL